MEKDLPQAELSDLQAALNQLQSFAFPAEIKNVLDEAVRSLVVLSRSLEASQEQKRLAALYRFSHVLGSSLDLDEVLTQVMEAVIGLTQAERGFIVLLGSGPGEWQLQTARNFGQENLKEMGVSRTVIGAVLQSGKGILTTDARFDPRFAQQDSVVIFALRSILCAPLLLRGRVIGAIYVDNRAQSGIFTADDLELLNAFAAQAAIAIENARLYTQTDQALARRVAELETLTQMDLELNASLDLSQVMEITRRWAIKGTGAEQCEISLVADMYSSENAITQPDIGHPPALDDPIYSLALQDGAPQIVLPEGGSPARLLVPLSYGGRALGIITAARSVPFTDPEIQFLTRLASRAAVALENARLYRAVEQANQAKSRFVSVVTHELRSPMTSIKGYTDLLRQGAVGPLSDHQIGFLNVIRSNVERMSALVSDLSDISRIETGRLKLEVVIAPLHRYVEETMRSFYPSLDEKGQIIEVDISPDLPLVRVDPNRLVQILSNLVSNACKYTPEGGRIAVMAREEGERLRLEVTDNGIGVSPQDQAYLFTQFFRSENPMVREQQGWGLGLNVTKRLVEAMGGEIGVHSIPGRGSTFWFTLPFVRA